MEGQRGGLAQPLGHKLAIPAIQREAVDHAAPRVRFAEVAVRACCHIQPFISHRQPARPEARPGGQVIHQRDQFARLPAVDMRAARDVQRVVMPRQRVGLRQPVNLDAAFIRQAVAIHIEQRHHLSV